MPDTLKSDLRAAALGIGAALLAYYGLATVLMMAGDASMDRPMTWLGLAAGTAAVSWSALSRRRPPDAVAH